jgi:hypothetical protein
MKKILILVSFLLSACTTIHFDNGSVHANAQTQEQEQWHHNFMFSLVEGSAPVNLDNECGEKEWSSVKTELTFINYLAGSVVNFFAPIWYPKTVGITCK